MVKTQPTLVQQPVVPDNCPLGGSCQGRFVLTSLPVDFLNSLLPPELKLAPQTYSREGYHPLMLMHNRTHLHSTTYIAHMAGLNNLELKLDYNEFIIMLPFVQFRDNPLEGDKLFCFLPVLYLDSLLAVIGGRIFWDFNKVMARFQVSDDEFSVSSEVFENLYFTSAFQQAGNPVPAVSIKNFTALIPILNLPVVEFGNGHYITSIYKIEYETANLVPTVTSVHNKSCKYLPPDATIVTRSIEEEVLGAFDMSYNWELSWATKIPFQST